jgi:hypothetical protein
MANEKLIYASAARRAILKADPKLAFCIDNIPGVDAVEVVRCKDCVCRSNDDCQDGRVWCMRVMRHMEAEAFCSFGKTGTQ